MRSRRRLWASRCSTSLRRDYAQLNKRVGIERGSPSQARFPARHTSSFTASQGGRSHLRRNHRSVESHARGLRPPRAQFSCDAPIQPRSTTPWIGTRCTSGGRCCAFQRSNSASLAASQLTARFSNATKPRSTISSDVAETHPGKPSERCHIARRRPFPS